MKLILIGLIVFSVTVCAQEGFKEDRMDADQIKMIKQEMQERPSSTVLGGARSGALETEKKNDDPSNKDLKRQKRLYQSEEMYIEGYRKSL